MIEQGIVRGTIERHQAPAILGAAGREDGQLRRFGQFKRQVHNAPAALAQTWPERKAFDMAHAAIVEHCTCNLDGTMLEVATTNRIDHAAGLHQHVRALLART